MKREKTSLDYHSVIFMLWFCYISVLLPIGTGEERDTGDYYLPSRLLEGGGGWRWQFFFKSLRSFLDLWHICSESLGERRLLYRIITCGDCYLISEKL